MKGLLCGIMLSFSCMALAGIDDAPHDDIGRFEAVYQINGSEKKMLGTATFYYEQNHPPLAKLTFLHEGQDEMNENRAIILVTWGVIGRTHLKSGFYSIGKPESASMYPYQANTGYVFIIDNDGIYVSQSGNMKLEVEKNFIKGRMQMDLSNGITKVGSLLANFDAIKCSKPEALGSLIAR